MMTQSLAVAAMASSGGFTLVQLAFARQGLIRIIPPQFRESVRSKQDHVFQAIRNFAVLKLSGARGNLRERMTGAALALLVEALLLLALLSLDFSPEAKKKANTRLVSVTLEQDPDQQPKAPEAKKLLAAASIQRPQLSPNSPAPPSPLVAPPVLPPPAIIPIKNPELAQFDLSQVPRQTKAGAPGMGKMGPPDLGVPGDSKRVGSAPNGEPMYAAAWYREPYDSELAGYLQTADGPGWALIACRTVPEFKVDDCVGLDEYPDGSHILRSILAAAWQFRVRPPRVGGATKYGEWVRIRIDYGIRGR